MSVRPSTVDFRLGPDQALPRLVRELQEGALRASHFPPEQMGWIALEEIRQGRHADAALWLAVASYRYHQQMIHAYQVGKARIENPPPNVNVRAYGKLVLAEIQLLRDEDFFDAMTTLSFRAHGSVEREVQLQDQLASLGRTSPIERESAREAFRELHAHTAAGAVPTRYPTLAEAFQERLIRDIARDAKDWFPRFVLAATPIAALQTTAMEEVREWFEPVVCSSVAQGFPELRPAALANLAAVRPQVRANAAAILALAPSQESLQALQGRLAVEKDPRVTLALAYALTHHGVAGHVEPLNAAARACNEPTCSLAVGLLNWLPRTVWAEVDRAAVMGIVANPKVSRRGRAFAAATAHNLNQMKPLDLPEVETLLVAARSDDKRDRLAEIATEAVANAAVLSHAEVVSRLDVTRPGASRQDRLFPAPLLARLGKVTQPDDLPLLGAIMERFGTQEGREAPLIIAATLKINGEEADARLMNWFRRYPRTQLQIAVGLARRPTIEWQQLQRLVENSDGRVRLAVRILRKLPDEQQMLLRFLASDNADEVYAAAGLADKTRPYARDRLAPLLNFRDARYYPHDGAIRFAAMTSLVNIMLAATRPAPAPGTTPTAPQESAAGGPPLNAAPPAPPN